MNIHKSFFILLAIGIAACATINSDSYIDLKPQGYSFKFSDANGPVQLSITGLPQNLSVQDYTVKPVGPVEPGQYILSVKASDRVGKDEKILIMNVDSAFTTFTTPPATPPTAPTVATQASSTFANSATSQTVSTSSTYNSDSSVNISSISALFQADTNSDFIDSSASSVDGLQSYFNGIDTSSVSTQTTPSISSSLNQILTDFSNTTSSVYTDTNESTVTAQTIVTQNSINLNFNNSQKSTVSTVEANLLFQKQKQASEWVAGNYSIVLQLTSDKNSLNFLIASLTQQYQVHQEAQKQATAQLSAAINNKSKIDSAISNLNGLLSNIKTQISSSSSKLTDLQNQKQTLTGQAGQTQSNVQQINQNIQSITTQIQSTNASLSTNQKTCDSFSSNLLQTNKTLNIYNSQLGLVSQQIDTAASDIVSKKAIVDDLMKQLAIAQQKLQQAQDNSDLLIAQKNQLQQNISTTGNSITSISQNLNSCNTQSSTIKQTIISLQTNLTVQQNSLAQYTNQNNGQSSQIGTIQSQIAQETANYNNLQTQNSNAVAAYTLLQSALPNATATVTALTTAKSQADLTLQGDLASLNAAIAHFKNQSANLQMATMHLQNARALSQQADRAVNTMLAQRGNILPFAVAVNSTQSALFGQTVVSPSINISNWFNYISANFGSAAYPYQSSRIQCLYSFTLAALNLRNTIPCPSDSDTLQAITGKVIKISAFNEIVIAVDANGGQRTIEIPTCATLSSNIDGYKVSVGDSALIKGTSQSNNTFVGKSIVFLRQ